MKAIDEAAPETTEVLVGRAAAAVARHAVDLLGGTYGRRVVVVAGKGNNGEDGRVAAARLRRRGIGVIVLEAADLPDELPPADLLIDAAYGTGFRGTWTPPRVPDGTPVLAVDIASGIDGLSGRAHGSPWTATRTVTFAALKPGLVLGDGPEHSGSIEVADIGLDPGHVHTHLIEDADVAGWLPDRARDTHKWRSACWIVAGGVGMTGSAHLAARGAQRAGAGYVRLSSPGLPSDPHAPAEVVGVALPQGGWSTVVLDDLDRFAALGLGPGLGTGEVPAGQVLAVVSDRRSRAVPLVLDADGLTALAHAPDPPGVLAGRDLPVVLTPHDGERARLADALDLDRDHRSRDDHIGTVRKLAGGLGAVILAKGSTTVVADPDGEVLVTTTGDARLASAGTGDVLTGVVTALLAQGLAPARAAAAGAHLHGRAGALSWRRGLVAGDVADHLPLALAALSTDPTTTSSSAPET